eukprot:5760683-Pyramimonas_sp.AAC.1
MWKVSEHTASWRRKTSQCSSDSSSAQEELNSCWMLLTFHERTRNAEHRPWDAVGPTSQRAPKMMSCKCSAKRRFRAAAPAREDTSKSPADLFAA